MKKAENVVMGALAAIAFAFPLAALCALVFRFPIPMDAYRSGPSAVPASLFAVFFYGVLGGFVVLGVLGGLGGVFASGKASSSPEARKLTLWLALAISAAGVLLLAVLDYIIGPW